jgi:hypothetical protein
MSHDAKEDDVIAVMQKNYGNASYVLLKRNIESVLQAAKDCGYKGSSLSMALDKDRAARDIVFAELSHEGSRSIRDCILGKMESLQQLVSKIADLLRLASIAPQPGSDV